MKKRQVVSIFTVTEYKTGKSWDEYMDGDGNSGFLQLKRKYPRHTKFVLEGFEIDGDFRPLDLRTYNRA
jgi:hypothetical protein